MMKPKYIAGAAQLLLLAAGCTTQPQVVSSGYEAQLTQSLNQPESTVIATWGNPSVRAKLSDGGDALVFVVLDDTGTNACSTALTTDSSHTVRAYSYASNGCPVPTSTASVVRNSNVSQ